MSLKRQIRWLHALFVVLLASSSVTVVWLVHRNISQYDEAIHRKSRQHLEILGVIGRNEAAFGVHAKALACALGTGDDKCILAAKDARETAIKGFDALEKINGELDPRWVQVENFTAANPERELRDFLDKIKAAADKPPDPSVLQPVFYLSRAHAANYFRDARARLDSVQAVSTLATSDVDINGEQSRLELLYRGFDAMREHYNRAFWDASSQRDSRYQRDTFNTYILLIAFFTLLTLLSVRIMTLTRRHFRREEQRDETLILTGTRDLATGFYNRSALESLLTQEIKRSQRRNHPFCLILLRLENFEQINLSLGEIALNRLFFQIAELLKTHCRAYDSFFRADERTFTALFPETSPASIPLLVTRIRAQIDKRRFTVKADQTKVSPGYALGASAYPISGATVAELLNAGEKSLAPRFDGKSFAKQTALPPSPVNTVVREVPDVVDALAQTETGLTPETGTANELRKAEAPPDASEIRVVKSGEENVIMVDMDCERDDLAEKFRKKRKG